MDWTTQTEDLITAWMGVQEKMWAFWLRPVAGAVATPPTGGWEPVFESWRAATEKVLEAHTAWTKLLLDEATAGSTIPYELVTGPQPILELMQRWTAAQQPFWERWFAALKEYDPAKLASTPEVAQVTQAWQDAVQKALAAQQAWVRTWTAAADQPAPPPDQPATP